MNFSNGPRIWHFRSLP